MRDRRVLYTVEEAARLLGISRSTVHRWAREGELRTVPVGSRLAVPASSLEELLSATHGEPTPSDEALNAVAIAGRLVTGPEVRESRRGLRYVTVRLTVQGGGPHPEPFRVTVLAFGTRGDLLVGLDPGALVRVDGRLAERHWTTEDGVRIGVHRIVAESVRILETVAQAS